MIPIHDLPVELRWIVDQGGGGGGSRAAHSPQQRRHGDAAREPRLLPLGAGYPAAVLLVLLKETRDESVPLNRVVVVVVIAVIASDGAANEEILTETLIRRSLIGINRRVMTILNDAAFELLRRRVQRGQKRRNVGNEQRGQRTSAVDFFIRPDAARDVVGGVVVVC